MSNIFFTADTHFSHDAIRKHCNRPFPDTHTMNKVMVENWNALVNGEDTVYVIGDFAFRNHEYFIQVLKGKKIFIVGNHDKMKKHSLDQFTQVIGKNKTPGILETKFEDQYVTLCHYRQYSWRHSSRGAWHFYGHSHGRIREDECDFCCDVGVDVWDYTPVSWERLKRKNGGA